MKNAGAAIVGVVGFIAAGVSAYVKCEATVWIAIFTFLAINAMREDY